MSKVIDLQPVLATNQGLALTDQVRCDVYDRLTHFHNKIDGTRDDIRVGEPPLTPEEVKDVIRDELINLSVELQDLALERYI